MNGIAASARRARAWLFDEALPIWTGAGFDADGFVEKINLDGRPTREPRRTMVQARQTYAVIESGRIGWTGPWREMATEGLRQLDLRALPGGGYGFSLDPETGQLNPRVDLYAQAFVLFALAHAWQELGRPAALKDRALELVAFLRRELGHEVGGFDEARPRALPLRSNPHMHLLEAALAWMDGDDDPAWRDLAAEIAGLFDKRFTDPRTGALLEYFDEAWNPITGLDGEGVEPGHQYEWAWLIDRWGRHAGVDVVASVSRLARFADAHGLDPNRQVAINEVWLSGGVKDDTARLWPQTERIKAGLTMARVEPEQIERCHHAVNDAVDGLFRYFQAPTAGLWYDKCRADGTFVDEPAFTSSLYHIVCAFAELIRAAE